MNSRTTSNSSGGVSIASLLSFEQLGRVDATAINFFGWESMPETGEARLMRAILRDAIKCFQRYTGSCTRRGRRELQAVQRWFTEDDEDYALSFINVCSVLRLDPRGVRSALNTWQEQQRNGRPNANKVVSLAAKGRLRHVAAE